MKCPVCTTVELKMSERQGVEIDYCPECRGIWLDRGELDKIIEKSYTQPQQHSIPIQQHQQTGYRPQHHDKHHDKHGYEGGGYQRKKSWFSEIFD